MALPRDADTAIAYGTVPSLPQEFTPGTLIGVRYRIVSLVGRGGMGAVYRADDLKLGQPVALKFLTYRPGEERRLYDEVRAGRQVSHPNVCRLHDIVESGSQIFISMEFVDGEDLSSLPRRAGRLPPDRGLVIAREICAGLAAAHHKGVIHRDLKPGNVMIDGHGHARITDFGLAVSHDAHQGAGSAGTPAYMAPEQLAGGRASVQSDIFALGLVLYELFTGRRAFEASSIAGILERQRGFEFTRPTSIVRDLDPSIERVINRCLDPDPANRPQSVDEILQELPDADPLAAALAAGQTPSPEMVAAAADRGDLTMRQGWVALALFAIALVSYVLLTRSTLFHHRLEALKPPAVLQDRAAQILSLTGHRLEKADATYFLLVDSAQMRWMQRDGSAQPPNTPLNFSHRQSPAPMRSSNLEQRIDNSNPPLTVSGMAQVQLDSAGRLRQLTVVPPQREDPPTSRKPIDWRPFHAAAGLDSGLHPDVPRWAAPVDSDEKAAWTTTDNSGTRVEAAAYHGKPVWFAVIRPWDQPARMIRAASPLSEYAVTLALAGAWCIAAVLALRNMRRARVDRRGALRLAKFVFATCIVALALRAHHPGGLGQVFVVLTIVAHSLTLASATWLGYVAIEPLVRRRWPGMLVGWSRLLAGQIRDPLVGRDVLIGTITGTIVIILRGVTALPAGASPLLLPPSMFGQFSDSAHWMVRSALAATFLPLAVSTLLLGCFLVTRSVRAACVLMTLIAAVGTIDYLSGPDWMRISAAIVIAAMTTFILLRFGLLTLTVSSFTTLVLMRLPITTDTDAWYFGRPLFGLAILAVLAMYGFVTALGGKSLVPDVAVIADRA